MTHWSRSLSASVRNVLVKTDVKVEGTRYRWFSGKLDKVMVVNRWQRVCLDGSFSSWRRVWSGVPRGSVLGPVLFLIFINDLDNAIFSNVLKFADDTKVYKVVDNHFDGAQLQSDMGRVQRGRCLA